MGWFGHGLYDGDGTQTCHIEFIKTAIPSLSYDDIYDFLRYRKTKIPQKYLSDFRKGIGSVVKKTKKPRLMSWNEDIAIEWQMLLSLFVDNDLQVPYDVLVYGMLGCHYLLGEHAADFSEPRKRRAAIKRFMKKVDEYFCSVKARKQIYHLLKS